MNGRWIVPLLAAACNAIIFAAGCSRSPAITFHTLGSPVSGLKPGPEVVPCSIAVGPVTIPQLYDRPQLVVRTGPHTVQILEYHRWGEPLADNIQRAILERLNILLQPASSRLAQHKGPASHLEVSVDIGALEAVPGKQATLNANWLLRGAASVSPVSGHFSVREPITDMEYESIVAAYARSVGKLSEALAEEVHKLFSDGTLNCTRNGS